MSKARQLADLGNQVDDGAITGSNMVINGGMTVAQRGVSATGINVSNYYTVDRFTYTQGSGGGSGVLTMTQEDDAPEGFAKSAKFEVTTSDTLSGSENILFRTRLEGQNLQQLKYGTINAQSITLSFWVKSSLTGTYTAGFNSVNTTDSSSIRYYKGYTVNAANTWEYKTLTIPAQTTNTIDSDNSQGLDLEWVLDAGPDDIVSPSTAWANTGKFAAVTGQVNFMATSGATWQITGVCLNVGDSAIAFPHQSYGDELQRCMRYYWRVEPHSSDQVMLGNGYFWASTGFRPFVPFPTTMRAEPSVTSNGLEVLSLTSVDNYVSVTASLDEGKNGIGLNVGDVSGTVGYSGILRVGGDAGDYFAVDAEL